MRLNRNMNILIIFGYFTINIWGDIYNYDKEYYIKNKTIFISM